MKLRPALTGILLFSQGCIEQSEGTVITPRNYKSNLCSEEEFGAISDPRGFYNIAPDPIHTQMIEAHYESYCKTNQNYANAIQTSLYTNKDLDPKVITSGMLFAEACEHIKTDRDGLIRESAYVSPAEQKAWNNFVGSKKPCPRPS